MTLHKAGQPAQHTTNRAVSDPLDLTEKGYGKNASEWPGKAVRECKHRTTESRKAKEEMYKKEKPRI